MVLFLSAWLRPLFSRKPNSSLRRDRRPMLEVLEDRWLPSLPTSTILSDSASGFSTYGQNVTFTASVTSGGVPVNVGWVDFTEGGVVLASVSVNGFGQA